MEQLVVSDLSNFLETSIGKRRCLWGKKKELIRLATESCHLLKHLCNKSTVMKKLCRALVAFRDQFIIHLLL